MALPILAIFVWSLISPSFSANNVSSDSNQNGKQSICELTEGEIDIYAEETGENLEGDSFYSDVSNPFEFQIIKDKENSCLCSEKVQGQGRPLYLLYHRMKVDPLA